MELPPLQIAAMGIMDALEQRGIKTKIVLPELDDRYFVYMLGRGVPPPKNRFRWCTPQLKIEPMLKALGALKEEKQGKFLMLTGVRLGESAARDARIALSCSKDGAECGQGYFQEATPEALADTLAPLVHWRVCFIWKWLREYAPRLGFPTQIIADAYGGDEAEEINARTGCVGCNLASRDVSLDAVLLNPEWSYLSPLKRLRPLYQQLKLAQFRLRKHAETKKDGTLSASPNRMGPLNMEARRWALEQFLSVQTDVNSQARKLGRPEISLINDEELNRIHELIAANTWPDRWSGEESRADIEHDEVLANGAVQPVMFPGMPFGGWQ
jgi:DNA sulfur modification protein DndC